MRKISLALAICMLSSLALTSCKNTGDDGTLVLRVASWDEYIDMGGELYEDEENADFVNWYQSVTGIDLKKSRPLYEEFETWYEENYHQKVRVEYIPLQDNETMYNMIQMGNTYDLLCPSEYLIMKLAAENMLEEYPTEFYNTDPAQFEHNYYAQNVSHYIESVAKEGVFNKLILSNGKSMSSYAAGYMWGTTGFIYNPADFENDTVAHSVMSDWSAFTAEECYRRITAKDNVRDSYFAGLGLLHQDELLRLKNEYENGLLDKATYQNQITEMMSGSSSTSEETMSAVKKELQKLRKNVYGLETDEAKLHVLTGTLTATYQWSGDAVFVMDTAENTEDPIYLNYSIPASTSNLWFDGWAMLKGANVELATAFINFLSRPDNVVRNMYYIGYTSCIASDLVYQYVDETYSYYPEEGEESEEAALADYDLNYFFANDSSNDYVLQVEEEQTYRQLFAQYPDATTIDRLIVMKPFDKETNERANRMWNDVK
ncbi:MAG: extracellular solute-binding protein [Clostridia bacterium]|nr:extracellular solute-binding protein [Clostridia bacterium]